MSSSTTLNSFINERERGGGRRLGGAKRVYLMSIMAY